MGTGRGRRSFGQEVKVEEMRHWVQAGDGWSFGGKRRGGGGRGVPGTARLLILRARTAASSGRADSERCRFRVSFDDGWSLVVGWKRRI